MYFYAKLFAYRLVFFFYLMHPTYQMLCQHLSIPNHKLTKKFEDFPIVYEITLMEIVIPKEVLKNKIES